jgi:hypothetical protein
VFGATTATSNIVPHPAKPAAPTNVVARWTVDYTQAEVTWDPVPHATSYEVLLFRTYGDGPLQSVVTQIEDHKNITTTTFTEALVGQNLTSYQSNSSPTINLAVTPLH